VPKGKSIVRLEYRSEPFHATLKLSLVVLIVFVLSAIALGVYRYKLKK
jgi:ABC-type dipeptide/oligopeptide/nickel transport system permease component